VGHRPRRDVDDDLAVPGDDEVLAVGDLADDGRLDVQRLQMAMNSSSFAGSTTASIRSWLSDMRISSGRRLASRSGTRSSSTCMPPSPLEASSLVAQESPAPPRSWMPSTTWAL
jgi:hypothetical protein